MSRPDLTPRNGHTLVVGVVARISGCAGQKELSLEDQVDHAKEAVAELYAGPVEYRVVVTKGKGESLDRPELEKIRAMLRSTELDLLVAEDLGRIVRGTEAMTLCGLAVDHGTRVLAPNDCVDTADESWEEDVISACRDHVGHNAHTSKRLKQKLMNRFVKHGGATARQVYGYIKPEGSKTYDEWRVDPAATPVYGEWFAMLRRKPNCSAVADWLNDLGVATGPYARRTTWDGAMVRRVTANPILKGTPARGTLRTVKNHARGRRVSAPSPDGPRYRDCPHLAHVDADLWDEVNARLEAARADRRLRPDGSRGPRLGVPRKRTRFPGQHARCAYCGREYVWGGNGVARNLMCGGSRLYRCWNSVAIDGARAADAVVGAIAEALAGLEGLDGQIRAMVGEARLAAGSGRDAERRRLEADEAAASRRRDNLIEAIAEVGSSTTGLKAKLAEVEADLRDAARRRRELERLCGRPADLPGTADELRALVAAKLRGLAAGSPELGDALRELVPELEIHLVRLADGGHLLPRARLRLDLSGVVADAARAPGLAALLARELTVDLFEPPQRERIRVEAARLEAEGHDQRDIAGRLAEPATQAAVWKALRLDRLVRDRGLGSPYEYLNGPPGDYTMLRRHLNPRYRFEPLDPRQATP